MKAYQHLYVTGSINVTGSLLVNGEEVGAGGGGNTSVYISGSAPSGSATGSLWFNENDLNMYVQYYDGTSSFWLPVDSNQTLYANSSSYAATSSLADIASTASFVTTLNQQEVVISNNLRQGTSQVMSGTDGVAFGNANVVSASNAAAFGNANFVSSSAVSAFVVGMMNSASVPYQTVVGTLNAVSTASNDLFVIGNGDEFGRKNLAVFNKNVVTISGSVLISGSLLINGSPAGAGGGATVTITGSAPSGSKDSGSLWWNETDGNLYVQVTSPTGSTYVPATNTVAGGQYGATYVFSGSGAVWTINHNLGTRTPLITVYSGSSVMIPATITSPTAQTTLVTFSGSVAGTAILSTGIGNANIKLSESASIATSASFATTASTTTLAYANVFLGGVWPTTNNTDITISAVSGSGVTAAANVITIQNAGVYTLSANLSIPSTYAEYFWTDTSNVQVPGTNVGISVAPTSSFSTAPVSAAGIITVAAGTQIKLRTSLVSNVVSPANPYYYNVQIIQLR
jgi:hypothetical protein